jgi:hypothetical protein
LVAGSRRKAPWNKWGLRITFSSSSSGNNNTRQEELRCLACGFG